MSSRKAGTSLSEDEPCCSKARTFLQPANYCGAFHADTRRCILEGALKHQSQREIFPFSEESFGMRKRKASDDPEEDLPLSMPSKKSRRGRPKKKTLKSTPENINASADTKPQRGRPRKLLQQHACIHHQNLKKQTLHLSPGLTILQ